MDNQQALKLIKVLVAAYPRQEMREDTIKVYVSTLSDLDYKATEKSIMKHIRTSKWFPTIAEIREDVAEALHEIPSLEDAMTTLKQASGAGNYALMCSNDILKQAVDTVGWQKLTHSEFPDPLYRQVKDAYAKLRGKHLEKLINSPGLGYEPQLALGRHVFGDEYKYEQREKPAAGAIDWLDDDEEESE